MIRRQWFSALSFRTKLMVAAVVCILLPAFVTLSIYNILTESAVKKQAISNSQQAMLLASTNVSASFQYMLNIANTIQTDSELNTIMMRKAYGEPYTGPDAEYQQLIDTKEVLRTIDTISVTPAKVKPYVTILLKNEAAYSNYDTAAINPSHILHEPWFESLNSMYGFESYWRGSPTIFRSDENPTQVLVARTLRGQGSAIFGYVIVTVNESQIRKNFERLEERQEFMILDSDNVIVSHNDPVRIGQVLPQAWPSSAGLRTEIIKNHGEDYLMTQMTIGLNGWKLVSLIPYKNAVANISSIFNNVFVLQFISFALFLFLFVYLLRTFTKPLVKLGRTALAVQRGNLQVRTQVTGGDEIGQLGRLFDQMLDRIHEMIREVSDTHARKRKAELAMLQAQINPHFLFNVLNSIRMKVMLKGDKDSAEMIGSLSKLLRMTIEQDKSTITLHEEVEIAIDYVQLMNMRQKNKSRLQVEVSADAFLERVPRFILQPLIENALIHGLNQAGGCIRVSAWTTEQSLILVVEDDGNGMDADALAKLQAKLSSLEAAAETDSRKGFSSIGLSNVNERMRMTYGDSFRMKIKSRPGAGTRILMSVPKGKAGEPLVQSHAGG